MRTLCFGGSFNPIHHAHLICARSAAETSGFDRVLLIPTSQPPHKPNSATLAAPTDRLAMTRLAVEGDPFFAVDDIELTRCGPSYTFDTVRFLTEREGRPVHWLIGADMLMYLPKWHRGQELIHMVNFLVMARPGWSLDWEKLPPEFRKLREHVIEVPQIAISATQIRERVAAGLPINYLTPPAVCKYIADKKLYRS
ncbi:MAG: NadD [Phycisphaerales bacterium]|nr:NadD [Phycisphaerales bacterium]